MNSLESHASILKISDEKTSQLLDLYSKEPCLWNTKIEDYKNREKRSAAAEKIARTLGLPHFTAKHVMMKFKNLRNSYSQELKKIANSLQSGAKGDDLYKPRVFWFSKMDSFIKPHLQVMRGTHEALPHRNDDSQEDWHVQYSNSTLGVGADSWSEEDDDSSSRKRKRGAYPTAKSLRENQSANQMLKDISSHLHVLVSHNDDYYDTFGKYVASLLRSMPPKKAMAIQPRIVSLIANVALQREDEECEQARSSQEEMLQPPVMKTDPYEHEY